MSRNTSISNSPRPITACAVTSSLVAEVLSRAGGRDQPSTTGDIRHFSTLSGTKPKSFCRQSNVEYGSCRKGNVSPAARSEDPLKTKSHSTSKEPSSRKALRFSSPRSEARERSPRVTAYCDLPTAASSHGSSKAAAEAGQGDDGVLNTSIPGFAHIRSIPLSGEADENDCALAAPNGCLDIDVADKCENVMESIEQTFSRIMKIAHIADKMSRFRIRDLKGEVEVLSDKLKMKRQLLEKVEVEFESNRHLLVETREEVDQLNERVIGMTQAILKHEDMTYEVTRLEEDNCELKQENTNLQGEKDLLSNQVQSLINAAKGGEDHLISLRRIAGLEKKNYHLHRFMLQEQERNKEKGDKAMRRIRVLEMNLKRAEEEVYKFDELVEAIRNTCIESRSMRNSPALLHVVRLIDGLVEVEKKQRDKKNSLDAAASSRSSTTPSKMKEFPV